MEKRSAAALRARRRATRVEVAGGDRPAGSIQGRRIAEALPRALLIVSNLIPLCGVVWWNWDVGGVMTLYWSENLVIGFYTLVKMLYASPIGGLFSSAFFMVHFGGFCAVHGLFIHGLTGDQWPDPLTDGADNWPGPLVFLQLLFSVARHTVTMAPREWMIGFAAIVVSHGVSLFVNWFGNGEYRGQGLQKIMFAPYGRVVILHITILVGAFGVLALGAPMFLVVVLVVLKTGVDLVFHLRAHRDAG